MAQSTTVETGAARTLAAVRATTDRLFQLIPDSRWYDRPVPERHRLLFYLGHVDAFDWNLIGRRGLDSPSFHPEFDRLFAFGIDPQAGQAPTDTPADWPTLEETRRYVVHVRQRLDARLHEAPSLFVDAAIEHRLMHAETFTYLIHNLSEPLSWQPLAQQRAPVASPARRNAMIEIPPGTARLGRSRGALENRTAPFGWDNEFEEQIVSVPGFVIDQYKVTNGQYLPFVEAGAKPPHFWRRHDDQWFWRTLWGDVPLPLDWPVYVTHEEARAYAQWVGKALPTEAQFHRAAYGTPAGVERRYPWGDAPPSPRHGNFDFHHWDPVPVTATPEGNSAFGVSQLVGNGWEWTETLFAPFPGFQPFAFYPGYSAPFFDGEHYVLKGGSQRTAARLLRRSFRNWFRPNYPYVYAGFRCVDR
ncbi:SUMF1/EgtB/PvdO family nonheme iron enzyme [Candidatus Nitrospira bockiana]